MPWLTKSRLQSIASRLERVGMQAVIVSATMARIIHFRDTRNRSSYGQNSGFGVESILLYSGAGRIKGRGKRAVALSVIRPLTTMKMIQPNCRVQFAAEDVDFILSVLGHKIGNAECLVKLLSDEESRDLILDDDALFHRS